MSVRRSGDGDLSYSDHDVQHISHELAFLDSADAGPTLTFEDVREFEITERGLEPDELAELRAMRVALSIGTDDSPIAQDEIGAVSAVFESGYNLSGTEFLSRGRDTDLIDTDDSGTDDFQAIFRDTDEVGQLTFDQMDLYLGYSDTSDGTGGAPGGPERSYMIDFATMFGSGPFVDSVDDFKSSIRMNVSNVVADCKVKAAYSLYYRVMESESGRTRFGR